MIVIAGPCAAENRQQTLETARLLAASGVRVFRAGVWKPRSRPDTFEGVGEEALRWLAEARDLYGVEPATEVASAEHVKLCLRYGIRTLWIGARTTTNPFLVQQIADALADCAIDSVASLGTVGMMGGLPTAAPLTILVKNPLSPDAALWEGAIRRMEKAVGEGHVMAVHRGFTTAETGDYRNAPNWSVVYALRRSMPHLKLLLDPSHMAGRRELIEPLCRQAIELSYDGLMLESHVDPEHALSDAGQQLSPTDLRRILAALPKRRETNDASQELAFLRHEIDELDDTIWQLIARRMEVSREIGDYKRRHHMQVLQQERFDQLVARRLRWAEEQGFTAETVRAIMDAIHEESCRRQKD